MLRGFEGHTSPPLAAMAPASRSIEPAYARGQMAGCDSGAHQLLMLLPD